PAASGRLGVGKGARVVRRGFGELSQQLSRVAPREGDLCGDRPVRLLAGALGRFHRSVVPPDGLRSGEDAPVAVAREQAVPRRLAVVAGALGVRGEDFGELLISPAAALVDTIQRL